MVILAYICQLNYNNDAIRKGEMDKSVLATCGWCMQRIDWGNIFILDLTTTSEKSEKPSYTKEKMDLINIDEDLEISHLWHEDSL